MKIVNVPEENTLRSIGDPPNGIVVIVVTPEGPSFAIDPGWEPTQAGVEVSRVRGMPSPTAETASAVELVAACEGAEELEFVEGAAKFAVTHAAQLYIPELNAEALGVYVEFMGEVRDALLARKEAEAEGGD